MELDANALIDDYLDDELDESGAERLREWLEADPRNVRAFVRQIYLHRQLRDHLLAENVGRCLAASEEVDDNPPTAQTIRQKISRSSNDRQLQLPWIAVALAVGAIVGAGMTWQFANQWTDPAVVVMDAPDLTGKSTNATAYVARLVNVTNCRWDQSRTTASLAPGSMVRSGESLHLVEGAAEINLALKNGGMAALQLEGPLAMTLNSDGMPYLLYGHLTGSFSCDFDRFTLDTPLGRVNVSSDTSIGVIAAANKTELHVFTGSASLDLWEIGIGGPAKQMSAKAGSSLLAHAESDGRISVEHGKARESGFLTPAARAASQLHISDKYVAAITAAKPIAYWRFEGDVDGMLRNEMGDRLHCRMVGDAVRWQPGRDGSTIAFGATAGPGYLISDDRIESPIDSYSLELWAKPTYFHHATLFSLLQWTPPESPVGTHRMALEMCGPVSGLTVPYRNTDFHPGRVRFVHEAQSQFDIDCFSPDAYAVRQWQHLVAVKTPTTIRLFCNGKLASTKDAPGPLPGGLRVLMGQLLPVSPQVTDEVTSRLFNGELDEVAIYDRAISYAEIEQHFKLVHPTLDVQDQKKSVGSQLEKTLP